MLVLLDTGVLLRLFGRLDPNYGEIQAALKLVCTIITLNAADFHRYPGIVAQTPAELLASAAGA
jgi:hypothetical protein